MVTEICIVVDLEIADWGYSKDSMEDELRQGFQGRTTLDSLLLLAQEIRNFIESPDVQNVFTTLAHAINFLSDIVSCTANCNFASTFSALSEVFRKICDMFIANFNPSEQEKTYSELQSYQDSEIRSDGFGFEKAFFTTIAYLKEINERSSASVINSLEDKISANDFTRFLGKLQAKTEELMLKSDVTSASRAAPYINLYFKLAILRVLVLMQVYCIKRRSGYDQTSTNGVYAMVTESYKSDLEMLRNITEARIEKAVFLTLFHPTENDAFVQFLRIFDTKIPCIGQDKDFYSHTHTIHSVKSPKVLFEMSAWFSRGIGARKNYTDACRFKFEPIRIRSFDNIFYLKSAHWSKYYVYMCKNGTCQSTTDTPGSEGEWKVVRLENDEQLPRPRYLLSTIKWPGRFVYMESTLGIVSIKSTHDIKKVIDKGLWNIINA